MEVLAKAGALGETLSIAGRTVTGDKRPWREPGIDDELVPVGPMAESCGDDDDDLQF